MTTIIIETEILSRQVDLEDSLGVNADIFTLSFNKRKEQIEAGLRPSWKPDEHCFYRRLEDRSPSPARRSGHRVIQTSVVTTQIVKIPHVY